MFTLLGNDRVSKRVLSLVNGAVTRAEYSYDYCRVGLHRRRFQAEGAAMENKRWRKVEKNFRKLEVMAGEGVCSQAKSRAMR